MDRRITPLVIGVCRAPFPFTVRIAALVGIGAVLTALRSRPTMTVVPNSVWPILGSILIFRTIDYLHDVRYGREKADAVTTLSYFFLLPNAFFPLFPVVDAIAPPDTGRGSGSRESPGDLR